MLLKENATAEKLRGGYYTPYNLADFIVQWGFKGIEVQHVLEPSCGDGAFVRSLLARNNQNFECTGVEIIQEEAAKVEKAVAKNPKFNVINDDFYSYYRRQVNDNRFELIVGNPPYIRYQYLTEEQREVQSNILTSNGMKSNKLINSWVSFVVAGVQLLADTGKIGFVIPAELLQVAYSEGLRGYLMQHLQKITIVTFRELIFPNVEQEVVLLLAEKSVNHVGAHQIRTMEFNNITDLVENYNDNLVPFMNVELNNSKWTRYFLSATENQLINHVRQDQSFLSFDQIAEVDIGITTGNNKFFCVDLKTAEQYDLVEICRPLIARSVSMRGIKFDNEALQYNVDRGAKAYLLDFPDSPFQEYSEGQQRYILEGEEREENTGYKCRIRKRWYRVPSIWVPDAFFLRRNYLYPKVVSNEINAVSTDTMHRIRLLLGIEPKKVLLSYYNSITLAFTEIEGRSYGGGVLEILPSEVEKIMLPNLFDIDIGQAQLDELLEMIDQHVRNNDDILGILPEIDRRVLVEMLNIPERVVLSFRNMWLTLRERRLQRGRKR
ncbi:class I SAM-dependent methyltransferase [Bacillus pacificus]|uniref:class I SAM-dependent methyltransferase n=1 Tax=Bacillus pacificus TaxID=2026187 RepID=UPI002E1DF9A6|nr:class I SAM-dependent methyltransferase [Bacillus pacificus]